MDGVIPEEEGPALSFYVVSINLQPYEEKSNYRELPKSHLTG
jgi:hypothetical protein